MTLTNCLTLSLLIARQAIINPQHYSRHGRAIKYLTQRNKRRGVTTFRRVLVQA